MIQLSLPAGWASGHGLLSRHGDPRHRLDQIRREKAELLDQARAGLEQVAERHGVEDTALRRALDYVEQGIDDLFYDVEREFEQELEARDPV